MKLTKAALLNKDNRLLNYGILVFAAFLYGLKAVADKQVALATDHKLLATTITSLFSALFVIATLLLTRQGKLGFVKATPRQQAAMVGVGTIASGIVIYLTFVGLKQSSATFAALNQGVAALSTVMLATLLLKERLPKIFFVVLPVMIAGTYLVSVGKFELAPVKAGDLIILGAAVLIGISNVLARTVMKYIPSQQVTVMRFVFGALVSFVFVLITQEGLAISGLSWIALSGFLGGIFVLLLYEGIRRIGASLASSLIMLAPVFAAGLAWMILGDALNAIQMIGMLLVIVGGIMISTIK